MRIIPGGVILNSKEFTKFFAEECEVMPMRYVHNGEFVGYITAITEDDRFVITNGVMPTELYSGRISNVAVLLADEHDDHYSVEIRSWA